MRRSLEACTLFAVLISASAYVPAETSTQMRVQAVIDPTIDITQPEPLVFQLVESPVTLPVVQTAFRVKVPEGLPVNIAIDAGLKPGIEGLRGMTPVGSGGQAADEETWWYELARTGDIHATLWGDDGVTMDYPSKSTAGIGYWESHIVYGRLFTQHGKTLTGPRDFEDTVTITLEF